MKTLYQYDNGNTAVKLYEDGSKERTFEGDPHPVFPESIDIKITNYCDAGCSFCHEKSTTLGNHADLNKLLNVLSVLPPGVEIAIGGGNPLSHPNLFPFLKQARRQGLVPNITINQKHIAPFKKDILNLINEGLVFGVGISYTAKSYLPAIEEIALSTDNVVFHTISGINQVSDIDELHSFSQSLNKKCKILILGYKNYGFGINYYIKNPKVESNKYSWYTQLPKYFKRDNLVLSFDNLAINQLNLKRFFTEDYWSKFYMGDDFVYTMYIDAVSQTFAPSSTSNNRVSFAKDGRIPAPSLIDFFKKGN